MTEPDSHITPTDAKRILSEVDEKLNDRGVLVARAMLAMLTDSFQRFRPTIDGALEAMRDFDEGLRNQGVHSLTWMRLRTEMDYLTEESTKE